MQTMEQQWADERFRIVDQRFDRVEASIEALRTELRTEIRESNAELRAEIRRGNAELRGEIAVLHARFDAMQQTIMRIGAGLIGTLIAASAGLIATQL